MNLSDLVYRKTDSYEIPNPNPFLLGDRLYVKYIEYKIPSLYFLLNEDITNDTLTNKLTEGLGYITTSKINISFKAIINAEIINAYTYFNTKNLNNIAFPSKDQYDTFVAKIEESSNGDYYEFYGEHNGNIFEDFRVLMKSLSS